MVEREIVVFIGPEGSGKTTHARLLAEETGKPYVTTGDIIRDLAQKDPGPLGDECREMFASHGYLDGATLLEILVHRFSQEDVAAGLILDGGLRTTEETADFASMLSEARLNLPVTVIHLRIPGWMSLERLALGEAARKRKDDTIEGILSRLSKYYHQLGKRAAVIEEQSNWRLAHVDATKTPEEVYAGVAGALS
ncbi:MAG: nucleoside monophosphate kinase [Microgenomates group bacterium]